MSDVIYWELLRYEEDEKGQGYYRVIDRAETSAYSLEIPKFKKKAEYGDIILGHKGYDLEAYLVEEEY